MKKINVNVALAKAILNKKGITTQSEEYSDLRSGSDDQKRVKSFWNFFKK
jgi:hypothetical protein